MSSSSTAMQPYVQPGEPLIDFLRSFWRRQINAAETETLDYRHPPLPLARIKKVMKSDPEVKMIAADAPILFCKACEIFISEITARAFIIADANKRRTLSRSDIAKALAKSDQFDFLIDIVPRDDMMPVPPPAQGKGKGKKELSEGGREREEGESNGQEEMPASAMLDQLQSLLNPTVPIDRDPHPHPHPHQPQHQPPQHQPPHQPPQHQPHQHQQHQQQPHPHPHPHPHSHS